MGTFAVRRFKFVKLAIEYHQSTGKETTNAGK
jgi:hypothetical protein